MPDVLWNRIVAVSSPGMAFEYSSGCQVQSFDGTVLAQCFYCILTACRSKSA